MKRTRLAFLAAAVAAAVLPALLAAQDSPAVRAAVQLAAEGRSDTARALLNGVLAHSLLGEPAYVEALFWRARVATTGDGAERDLRRVALEFSTSAWADDALLQLSQLALAAGNPASSLELANRLRSDYPTSGLLPQAALWGARAAFEVGELRTACALLDSARSEAASDVEFGNQVVFYLSRCTPQALQAPPPPARRDTVVRPAPVQAPAPTPAGAAAKPPDATSRGSTASAAHGYEVQVAAAKSAAAAQDLVRRLGRAGLRARVVTGGHYWRVRLGPFPTAERGETAARAARRAVGGTPFVTRLP